MQILETERLMLRHLETGDLDELYTMYRDPEMRRYFPDGTRTYEETREELEWFVGGHSEHRELGLWATVLKESGRFAGRCGLLPWTIDGRFDVEVAYMIAKPFWRQGLATEAAEAIRDHAFDALDIDRLIALIDADHVASIGVASAIGMTFERNAEDETGPFQIYSMKRPEVRAGSVNSSGARPH